MTKIAPGRSVGWGKFSRRIALIQGTGLAAAIVAPGLTSRAATQEGTPVAIDEETLPAFPAEEQLALTTIVETRMGEQLVPGVVAGVWVPGRGAWTHATGIGDLQSAAPIAIDDHFRIASVSKTFVATAVLQLIDEGNLRFDDTLEPFVPGIANGDQITIRQLLGMTAGIFNFINDPDFERAYTENPLADYTPEEEIAIIRRHPADFAPGEKTQYSDSNYVLLGEIIEQVTGNTVAEVLTSRVLEPVGLANTSYPDTPELPEPYARGYGADPGSANLRDITRSNPVVANAAGAMISTLDDLRIWGRVLAEGTLLSTETQAERLQIGLLPSASGFTLGYGLGIMEINGFYGHNGAIFGYSTWLLHSPQLGATLVVLANRGETETEFAGTIALDLLHHLFPEQFPREVSPPPSATPVA
jgi:D-alanyl-D-alanine carboxypeptidase